MSGIDPFGRGTGRGRQPWFGPKRYGFGYGPRTWQGYLLVLASVTPLIIMAALLGGHSPIVVLGVIPPACVAVFARIQGRR
jgi:hypothetical protein